MGATKKEKKLDKIFVKEFEEFAKKKNKELGYEKWYIDEKTLTTNKMNESESSELLEYLEVTPNDEVINAVSSGEVKDYESIITEAKEAADNAFVGKQHKYLTDEVGEKMEQLKDEPSPGRGMQPNKDDN